MARTEVHHSSIVWMVVAVVLVFVALLYVGSYLALVRPLAMLIPVRGAPGSYDMRHYALGGAIAETIYWPLEQIDRRIRPAMWREPIYH